MKTFTEMFNEELELTEGVEKLMKHPLMKGLKKPKMIKVEDDLSGVTVDMLDFGKFRVGEDAGNYYIETPDGKAVLLDLVMTQLAPAVAALLIMEKR